MSVCISMIMIVIFFYGNNVNEIYKGTSEIFKKIAIEKEKGRAIESINRFVDSFDTGRIAKLEEYKKIISSVNKLFSDVLEFQKINGFFKENLGSISKLYDCFSLKFILFDTKENRIRATNDDGFVEDKIYNINEVKDIMKTYEYIGEVVEYNDDEILITGVKSEDLNEDYKAWVENSLEQFEVDKDVHLWVDEVESSEEGKSEWFRVISAWGNDVNECAVFYNNKKYNELINVVREKEEVLIYYNINTDDILFKEPYENIYTEFMFDDDIETIGISSEWQEIVYVRYYDKFDWVLGISLDVRDIEELDEKNISGFRSAVNLDIAIICLIFMFTVLMCIIVFNYYENMKVKLVEKENRLIQEHYEIMENKYIKNNQVIHDIKEHFLCIYGLAEYKNTQDIIEYIDNINLDFSNLKNIVVSGNKIIDIIINYKVQIMEREGIKFKCDIENVNLDFIRQKDLSVILGNMMNNAIEGAKNSEKKEVSLKIGTFNEDFVIIKIKNSCDKKPIQKKGKLITTKKSKEVHGYGLINTNLTLKRYNGNMVWTYYEESKEISFVITIPSKVE